ncbi:MAG: TSUP family transporter [Lachnospiraceae bacterium]|nr:TSUP family transporter [Lachnospiraceae bacterium]
MNEYLIVCPLVFLAGFVDSIGGGGGLISLPAFMLAGIPAHMSLATNKMASTMGTTVSTIRFARHGYMKWKFCAAGAVMALLGSPLGAMLALHVEETIIEKLMLVVLPVVAFYVLRKKNKEECETKSSLSDRTILLIVIASAFVIGIYDGFYGPGTGTFLILIFSGAAKMDTRTAAGTTKAINLSSNVAALITYIINGKVVYSMGITAGLFCIAGHYIGAGLVTKNGQKIVRPVILIVLFILFIKILSGMIE